MTARGRLEGAAVQQDAGQPKTTVARVRAVRASGGRDDRMRGRRTGPGPGQPTLLPGHPILPPNIQASGSH